MKRIYHWLDKITKDNEVARTFAYVLVPGYEYWKHPQTSEIDEIGRIRRIQRLAFAAGVGVPIVLALMYSPSLALTGVLTGALAGSYMMKKERIVRTYRRLHHLATVAKEYH